MRASILTALTALLLPVLPTSAVGPGAPPQPPKLRAWIVEWAGGSKPAVQDGAITFTITRGPAVIAFIGFEARGRRRELFGGYFSRINTSSDGHWYPSAWVDGYGELVPPCQVSTACENQLPPGAPETRKFDSNIPGKRSFYIITQGLDVHEITASPGWKPPRELRSGFAVRLVRKSGTGARANWFGVEHFTGATAPGGRYGSVAQAWIPCDLPGGSGSIVLKGGDPLPHPYGRPGDGPPHAQCDPPWPSAWSATNRQTTWRMEGEVTGYTVIPDRLVVVDLPRFP